MQKLFNFLMVGLAFTVLQVSTVAAQAPGAPVLTIDDPKCDGSDGPPRTDCPNYGQPPTTGGPPPMTGGMPPTTGGMPPMGDSCMTVPAGPDRDACYSSMSGSSMPPGAPGMAPGTN